MTNPTKPKRNRYVTPACACKWPRLLSPDTKFDPAGVYKVDLVMDKAAALALYNQVKPEADELAAKIRQNSKAAQGWKTAWPIKDEMDDNEAATGMKLVHFKQKARVVREGQEDLTFDVVVVDAKKHDVPADTKIGSGSTIKVSFNIRVVEDKLNKVVRVLFQIIGAQIITLVEYSHDLGFEEEEGYTAQDAAPAHAAASEGYQGEAGDQPVAASVNGIADEAGLPF